MCLSDWHSCTHDLAAAVDLPRHVVPVDPSLYISPDTLNF